MTKYKKDIPIKDLIDSFGIRFKEYVQSIAESGIDRPSFQIKRNERNGLIYLSKIEFLQMFLPDSPWWTDASLFSNGKGPFDFTPEERDKMIELMNIRGLLEDARSGSNTEEQSNDDSFGSIDLDSLDFAKTAGLDPDDRGWGKQR